MKQDRWSDFSDNLYPNTQYKELSLFFLYTLCIPIRIYVETWDVTNEYTLEFHHKVDWKLWGWWSKKMCTFSSSLLMFGKAVQKLRLLPSSSSSQNSIHKGHFGVTISIAIIYLGRFELAIIKTKNTDLKVQSWGKRQSNIR